MSLKEKFFQLIFKIFEILEFSLNFLFFTVNAGPALGHVSGDGTQGNRGLRIQGTATL